MRTPAQLIDELLSEAPGYWHISLVVGFEHHTEAVTAGDPDPVEKLADLVRRGGEPMGFIAFLKTPTGQVEMMTRPLQEWEAEVEWVTRYLAAYAESVAQGLIAAGRAKPAEFEP